MARKDQGNNIRTLIRQAGARFTKTRTGLDTGVRVWVVDRNYAARRQPRIGERDIVYRGMFLDSLEAVDGENEVVTFTGQYLGLLSPDEPKPDVFDVTTESEYSAGLPAGSVQPVTFNRPHPIVTHTYISKSQPDEGEVGIQKTPKGFKDRFVAGEGYWVNFSSDQVTIFEGWVLKSRNYKRAGLTQRGSLWEVVDVYSYEYLTVEAANYTFE